MHNQKWLQYILDIQAPMGVDERNAHDAAERCDI